MRTAGKIIERRAPVAGLCLGAVLLLLAGAARAQSLSPGPLSRAHRQLDHLTGCFNCHPTRGAKREVSCLGCHEHEAVKRSVDEKRGFHGTVGKPCLSCHTEHKGVDSTAVRWDEVGGEKGFRHGLTRFVLDGGHAKIACADCHKRRAQSGGISFTGLNPGCESCHPRVHHFTNARLGGNCRICHVPGGATAAAMKPGSSPFDHEKDAGFALVGRHAETPCAKCHKKGEMSAARGARRCVDCHEDRHGAAYAGRACTECHHPSRPFKTAAFDHGRTDFALTDGHAKVACAKCHRDAAASKPSVVCESCHKDPHRGRFQPLRCASCHPSGSTAASLLDHGRRSRFPLVDRHRDLRCRACHRGRGPADFGRLTDVVHASNRGLDVDCRRCHARAHDRDLDGKPCAQCHATGGSTNGVFVHDRESRFRLVGMHARVACGKCHLKGQPFRTGKLDCGSCHADPHGGQLGGACDRCHSPEVRFKKTEFDHGRVASFRLEGLHRQVACAKCHPGRQWKTGHTRCVDCHRESDPHQGRLGPACERCHVAEKGAPRFAHDTMTRFRLEDRHARTACTFCHRPPPPGGPPPVGWTAGLATGPVDRLFPVMGRVCAECHADPHGGRYGAACQSCHRPGSFKAAKAITHDTGAFRLEGVHAKLACDRCHTARRQLWGIGRLCETCHRDDDTVHRGALGPACGDCHGQVAWRPSRFSHVQTGFPLKGVHRTAPCQACHGSGSYGGQPTDCASCHRRDAAAVRDPLHTAELDDCQRCHAETAFAASRFNHPTWPLVGQHRFVRCRNCHPAGTYGGTPEACEACHLQLYLDPATQPNHQAAGYPPTCGDCHRPTGWRPATRR